MLGSASHLFGAGYLGVAVVLVDDNGVLHVVHQDIPENDVSDIPLSALK